MRKKVTETTFDRKAWPVRLAVITLALATMPPMLSAAEGSTGDCTEIDLRFQGIEVPLTDAEIQAKREQQQLDALNAFERCRQTDAGGGAGGNGSGNGGGGSGGGSGVAASGISGTQAPERDLPPEDLEVADEPVESTDTLSNGRAPADIPPADSDGALAAQLRQAAEAETDPERRKRLWNEYRKVRGLPTRE